MFLNLFFFFSYSYTEFCPVFCSAMHSHTHLYSPSYGWPLHIQHFSSSAITHHCAHCRQYGSQGFDQGHISMWRGWRWRRRYSSWTTSSPPPGRLQHLGFYMTSYCVIAPCTCVDTGVIKFRRKCISSFFYLSEVTVALGFTILH